MAETIKFKNLVFNSEIKRIENTDQVLMKKK